MLIPIVTERLLIRPPAPTDIEGMHRVFSDPEVSSAIAVCSISTAVRSVDVHKDGVDGHSSTGLIATSGKSRRKNTHTAAISRAPASMRNRRS
jgi:hypothetical protein